MRGCCTGFIRLVLVIPSTVYGTASGILHQTGIANRHSFQIPGLVKAAIERKRVGLIGAGKAIWNHVHIDDRASSVDGAIVYFLVRLLTCDGLPQS